jgi:hypothetical protein
MAKKKQSAALAEEIFALGQELLARELRHYREHPNEGRVPSALLTAALASGKATGAAERAAEETRRESQVEAANFTFESRITMDGADASMEALCNIHGLTLDDFTNIAARARREAAKCDEDSQQERENYLRIAEEAEAQQP